LPAGRKQLFSPHGKKAAAQNGRADLPVSQDAQQRVCDWHAGHYVKAMLDQILGETRKSPEPGMKSYISRTTVSPAAAV
jgi:hypothetical protein